MTDTEPEEIEQMLRRAYLDGYMECHEGYVRGGHYKAWKRASSEWEAGRERLSDQFEDSEWTD